MAEIKKEGMLGYMPYGYTQKPAMLGPYQAPAEGGPIWNPKPFLNKAEGYYQKRKQNDLIDLAYEGGGQEPVAAGNFRGMPVFRYPNGTLAVIGKDQEPRLMTAAEIGQFMEQRARSGSTERLSDGQTAGADVMNTVGEWDSRMQQEIGKKYPKLAETYETLTNPDGTPLDQASKYMHGLASEHESDGNLALSTFADLGGYGLDLAKNLPGFVLPDPTSPLQVGGEVFLGTGIPAAVGAYKFGKRVAPVLARDAKTLAQSTAKAAKDVYKGAHALPELWGAIKHKRALEAKLAVTQDPVLREQIIQELGDADLAIREQELRMPEQELGVIPSSIRGQSSGGAPARKPYIGDPDAQSSFISAAFDGGLMGHKGNYGKKLIESVEPGARYDYATIESLPSAGFPAKSEYAPNYYGSWKVDKEGKYKLESPFQSLYDGLTDAPVSKKALKILEANPIGSWDAGGAKGAWKEYSKAMNEANNDPILAAASYTGNNQLVREALAEMIKAMNKAGSLNPSKIVNMPVRGWKPE